MNRIPVASTNVESVGYSNGVLEVRFRSGAIYHYYNASEALYYQFLNAPSKGQFVSRILRNYRHTRVA